MLARRSTDEVHDPVVADPPLALPVDKGFDPGALHRPEEIGERKEAAAEVLSRGAVSPELDDAFSQDGHERDHVEQQEDESSLAQPASVRVVDSTQVPPTGDGPLLDRPPQGWIDEQPHVVAGDVGHRCPVGPLSLSQLVDSRFQAAEVVFVLFHEAVESLAIAPVELHDSAANEAPEDEPKIGGAHGQKGKQGKARPEIDGRQRRPVVHDAEYYVLEAQNGVRWAAED